MGESLQIIESSIHSKWNSTHLTQHHKAIRNMLFLFSKYERLILMFLLLVLLGLYSCNKKSVIYISNEGRTNDYSTELIQKAINTHNIVYFSKDTFVVKTLLVENKTLVFDETVFKTKPDYVNNIIMESGNNVSIKGELIIDLSDCVRKNHALKSFGGNVKVENIKISGGKRAKHRIDFYHGLQIEGGILQ